MNHVSGICLCGALVLVPPIIESFLVPIGSVGFSSGVGCFVPGI